MGDFVKKCRIFLIMMSFDGFLMNSIIKNDIRFETNFGNFTLH